MDRYTGVPCPVCGKPFTTEDDIVVCPICGEPHHRSCYHEIGHCANEEGHASGKTWEPPHTKKEDAPEDGEGQGDELICPACHTANPKGNIFCEACGAPLGKKNERDRESDPRDQEYGNPYRGAPNMGGFGNFYQLAFNPYGGLDPEEEIEGVKVKELAAFIGPNAAYYLPRFRSLSTGKGKIHFNWSAMIAGFMYFLYRKIYPIGIIAAVLFVLFLAPSAIFYIEVLGNEALFEAIVSGTLEALPDHLVWLQQIQSVITYVYMAFCIVMGFFANQIYKHHVFTKVRLAKEEIKDMSAPDQVQVLMKRGGVNRRLISILLAVFLAINFLFTLFIVYA